MIDLFVHFWCKYFLVYQSRKQHATCIESLKILISIDPLILRLGLYPKKEKAKIGAKAYITALFTLVSNSKQPKYPLKIYEYSYAEWCSWKFTSLYTASLCTAVLSTLWRWLWKIPGHFQSHWHLTALLIGNVLCGSEVRAPLTRETLEHT